MWHWVWKYWCKWTSNILKWFGIIFETLKTFANLCREVYWNDLELRLKCWRLLLVFAGGCTKIIWNFVWNIRYTCGILKFGQAYTIRLWEATKNYRCPVSWTTDHQITIVSPLRCNLQQAGCWELPEIISQLGMKASRSGAGWKNLDKEKPGLKIR